MCDCECCVAKLLYESCGVIWNAVFQGCCMNLCVRSNLLLAVVPGEAEGNFTLEIVYLFRIQRG